MKLKRVVALALAGVMVFSLGACGGGGNEGGGESGGGGGDLSVMIWDTYQEAGLKEILADFTEETGIGAEIQVVPWNEYWTLLEAGAQGGDMPDVFWMHSNESERYMSNDMLLDLTDKIAESDLVDMSKYPEDIKNLYTYEDKVYAVPKDVDTIALWYNKTMFDEAGIDVPTTMEEVVAAAKEVKDATGNYGFTFHSDYPWYIMALMYNSGTAPVVDGKPSMNTEPVKQIFQWVSQMANVDESMPRNQHATAQEDFCNGNIGMLMTSCASYAQVEKLVDGKFEIGLAMFPEVTTMDITMGGNGLGLFKTTPEKEKAAVMFVEFLLDDERLAQNCLNFGYIPVTNGATNTETYKEYLQDPNRQVVDDQLQYLGGAAVNPADSLVWGEVMSLVDSVEADANVDLDARLAEIDTKIEKYLNEYAGN